MNAVDDRKKCRISKLLVEHQQACGWSVREMALRFGVHPGSMQAWVSRISMPGPENRIKIARGLGITPGELEAQIHGVELQPQSSIEQLLQDVRSLPREDFLVIARAVCDRLLNQDEPGPAE